MALKDVDKLWRRRNEKLPPKAERKKPGKPIITSSGSARKDFHSIVTRTAIERIARRINQQTRDLYDGQIHVEENLSDWSTRISVCLTHKKDRSQLVGNITVPEEDYGSVIKAMGHGETLGRALVQELGDKHRGSRNPLPKRLPDVGDDYEERMEKSIARASEFAKPKKPKKPKKVCPICGPESDDYPEWDTECGHDF